MPRSRRAVAALGLTRTAARTASQPGIPLERLGVVPPAPDSTRE